MGRGGHSSHDRRHKMYIAPNSTLRILKNVPINSDYIHTLYFSTLQRQTDYLLQRQKYTHNGVYYLNRENLREINIERTTAELIDCNYIMYKKHQPWKQVDLCVHQRSAVSEWRKLIIVFEIDEVQTWLFNKVLKRIVRGTKPHDHRPKRTI